MNTIKHQLKLWLIQLQNFFVSSETIQQSKQKWSELAKKNARYFIWTEKDNPTELEFQQAGRADYEKYVRNDSILQEKLSRTQRRVALEIGCGIGRVTEFIGQDFQEVYGIDISAEMIQQARQRLPDQKFHFIEGDGVHLPVPSEIADFVFSFIVFQHMPTIEMVKGNLQEAYRVLRSGGIAKIQLRGSVVRKQDWFYGVHFSEAEARSLVQAIGFKVIAMEKETDRYLWLILEK